MYLDDTAHDQLVTQVLGPDPAQGHNLQVIVPSGKFMTFFPLQEDESKRESGFTLWSCVVSPGFDPADDTPGVREELVKMFPKQKKLIEKYTSV